MRFGDVLGELHDQLGKNPEETSSHTTAQSVLQQPYIAAARVKLTRVDRARGPSMVARASVMGPLVFCTRHRML